MAVPSRAIARYSATVTGGPAAGHRHVRHSEPTEVAAAADSKNAVRSALAAANQHRVLRAVAKTREKTMLRGRYGQVACAGHVHFTQVIHARLQIDVAARAR